MVPHQLIRPSTAYVSVFVCIRTLSLVLYFVHFRFTHLIYIPPLWYNCKNFKLCHFAAAYRLGAAGVSAFKLVASVQQVLWRCSVRIN